MEERQEAIGFLLAMLDRRKGLLFRALLAPHSITPRQYGILARLWEENGLHLNELAARLYADPTSLCRTLLTMEKAGLVIRRRDREDRRIFHIFLKERGRSLREVLRPLALSHDARLLDGLSPDEVRALRRLVKKMLANMRIDPG